jgi:putative hemolysin
MVHRHQIFSLDGNRSIGDALDEIIASSHYRIPLYSGNPDEINRSSRCQKSSAKWRRAISTRRSGEAGSEPLFVPPNQPVDSLLTCCGQTRSS